MRINTCYEKGDMLTKNVDKIKGTFLRPYFFTISSLTRKVIFQISSL